MNGTYKPPWHIARKTLNWKPNRRSLGRHSDKWNDIFVKLNFKETLCGGARWIHLAAHASEKRPRTFGFHKISEISWLFERLLASQGLCSLESAGLTHLFTTCKPVCAYTQLPSVPFTRRLAPNLQHLSQLHQIYDISSHWYPGHCLSKILQISQHTYTLSPSLFKLFSPMTYQLATWKQPSYLGHQAKYPTQRIYSLKTNINLTNKNLGPTMLRSHNETLEIGMTASGSQTVWIPNG
jgi:hypothetical protein